MKLMVISIIFLFIPSVYAIDFNFSSPKVVGLNETFTVSISSESSESYDVKIFIHNSKDKEILRSEILSDIYSTKWQDSWLYVPSSFPQEKEYQLRAINESNSAQICVQLRKTGKTSYDRTCNLITINPNSENSVVEGSIKNNEQDILTAKTNENISKSIEEEIISDNDKIILNAPSIQEFSTKQDKLRYFIIGSSFIISIILLVLILLKPRI